MEINKDFEKIIDARIAKLEELEDKTNNTYEDFCYRQEVLALWNWRRGIFEITNDIPKKVKLKLLITGMTQTQLAKKFNTSRQNLYQVINGKYKSAELEKKIMKWLKK